MKRRLSLITRGVKGVASARFNYERFGWKAADNRGETAFFQENGLIFGLWGRDELAADSGAIDDGGQGGTTLAQNVTSIASVDATLRETQREGAPTEWGRDLGAFAGH